MDYDNDIFKNWILSSCNDKYKNDFWIQWYNFLKTNLFYDPNSRRFTEYYDKIDVIPEEIWYLYRPVATLENLKRHELKNTYSLKIISTETLTKTTERNVSNLEQNLIRRYYNSSISNIAIIHYDKYQPEINSEINMVKFYSYKTSTELNKILNEIISKKYDLIFVSTCEEFKTYKVDSFVPTYPIVYDENAIAITPIQLMQINGVNSNTENISKSLLNRISQELGAVLIANDLSYDFKTKPESIVNGMSDYREGILKDGRFQKLIPESVKYIPRFGHGWITNSILSTLDTVCHYTSPKVIFELGSWYGLSSRIISHSMISPYTIYSVDVYKNSAISNVSYYKNSPENKMFLNHLRYETRCANEVRQDKEVNISRYFFDKQVSDIEHETIMVKMDIYEAIEIFYKEKISPDLIFIDFEKKTKALINLLYKLVKYFPKAIIVGDDLISPSVKNALKAVKTSMVNVYEFGESYIIYPQNIKMNKHYEFINTKSFKDIRLLNRYTKLDITKPFAPYALETTGNNITQFCKINHGKYENTLLVEEISNNLDQWVKLFPNPINNPGALTFFDYIYKNFKFAI
jgi:predicted O-methyltransferase YrrM